MYDQQILDTVYWSLGTVLLIFTVLIGYGWFVNFKLHERDKEILKKEILVNISREIDAIIEKKISEKIKDISKRIDFLDGKISDEVKNRISNTIKHSSSNSEKFSLCIDWIRNIPNEYITLSVDYEEPIETILGILQSGYAPSIFQIGMLNDAIKETEIMKTGYSSSVKRIISLIEK